MKQTPVRQIPIGEVKAMLRAQSRFPVDCVEPFAALIAHYGKRLGYPAERSDLRKDLTHFLDRQDPPDDFDDLYDQATHMLATIEEERGGLWPVEAPAGERARQVTSLQVERGLGKDKGRGLTDENMLLLMAVSILRTQCASTARAIDIVLDVFAEFGLPAPGPASAAVSVSRTTERVVCVLAENPNPLIDRRIEFHPVGVRAAYAQLATSVGTDSMVSLPS